MSRFQIKDFRSIVASMINHMSAVQSRITDFTVGSVTRTLIEAPAVEIDELYQRMLAGLKGAIPVALYKTFDFAREPAFPASGVIRVQVTASPSATLISAGTVFVLSGEQATKYASSADATIAPGDTFVDVYVSAAVPGAAGNLTALQSFVTATSINNFLSASNPNVISGGTEEETDEQRKWRFSDFVSTLSRGPVHSLLYGVKTVKLTNASGQVVERVRYAGIIEPYLLDSSQPVALVRIYIHNGSTGASANLLELARQVVHGFYTADGVAVRGWKAAGVHVEVFAAVQVSIDVGGTIFLEEGADEAVVLAEATSVVSAYISALDLGATYLAAEVVALVKRLDGVYDFAIDSTDNATSAANQKIVPGLLEWVAA